jgi:hypothetical protein
MTNECHIEREENISRKMQKNHKNCKIHSKESKEYPRWIWSVEEGHIKHIGVVFLKDVPS